MGDESLFSHKSSNELRKEKLPSFTPKSNLKNLSLKLINSAKRITKEVFPTPVNPQRFITIGFSCISESVYQELTLSITSSIILSIPINSVFRTHLAFSRILCFSKNSSFKSNIFAAIILIIYSTKIWWQFARVCRGEKKF